MESSIRRFVVLTIGVVALASCGRGGETALPATPPAGSPPASPSPPTASSPVEVPRELRFTEPRLGGGAIRGADFAGHDLVMWFWAPW